MRTLLTMAPSVPKTVRTIAKGKFDVDYFHISDAEVTLYDIAPTILDCLDINLILNNYNGFSLTDPALPQKRGKRYYHFYKKKDSHGWTDEMTKFVIDGKEVTHYKVIKLRNNSKVKKSWKIVLLEIMNHLVQK